MGLASQTRGKTAWWGAAGAYLQTRGIFSSTYLTFADFNYIYMNSCW